ncbi:glycosyltransferase family 39 protein [Maricaulis parjimensis]|uniref:glycosyltransferase family 39 protein n=1 Tax=Maricaulis parjimensis TaxID=144023 RepID=UPI00193AC2F2|nr:glycosyltransferase family 39 protein [Maricaulis parjimensis]
MTDSPLSPAFKADRWMQATLVVVAAFAIARIVMLAVSPVALHADESQYWVWSRQFDWGYFSKPPMIAWLIGLSTSLFGNTDFAVRLPAPLLHTGTALFLCLSARHLFNAKTGFFAALTWLTLPSIWLSGFVMSTDAILLCCWSGGLYALLRLRSGGNWVAAAGVGLAIGLGFLSKYAMIYFVIGLAITLVLDRATRQALFGPRGGLALAIALLCLAPNIAWNAAHDFATVSHTAANANWGGELFHVDEMVSFLTDQLAVFGPALFITLMALAGRNLAAFRDMKAETRLLLAFILPPLLAVTIQAFLSRAHANWAVSAYAASTLLVVGFLMSGAIWRRYVLGLSIAGHSILGLLMVALAASPALVVAMNAENATKRIRAWDETAAAIAEAASEGDYTYIVFDDRNVFHQTQRYAPQLQGQLRMWLRHAGPLNHAEDVWPLPDRFEGEILVVSHRPLEVARLREDFAVFEPAGSLAIPLDGSMTRDFTLWRASGPQRVERDTAYEERWQAIDAAAGQQRGYSTGESD